MTTYSYASVLVWDPSTASPARGATGQIYDPDDLETPLTPLDTSGVATTLVTDDTGVLPAFLVEDHGSVVWVSGSVSSVLLATTSVIEKVEDAADLTQQAADQVQQIIDGLSNGDFSVGDSDVAGYIRDSTSDTRAALTSALGVPVILLGKNDPLPDPMPDPALVVRYDQSGDLVTYASDNFGRTITGGWGSADVGGAWSINSASDWNVDGGVGTVNIPPGAGRQATLTSIQAQDTVFTASLVFPAEYLQGSLEIMSRYVGAGKIGYSCQLYCSHSQVLIAIRKNFTAIGPAAITAIPGDNGGKKIWTKLQVQGVNPTNLSAKAWLDGDDEPDDWLVTTTDDDPDYQTAGSPTISSQQSGSGTQAAVVQWDDVKITSVAVAE